MAEVNIKDPKKVSFNGLQNHPEMSRSLDVLAQKIMDLSQRKTGHLGDISALLGMYAKEIDAHSKELAADFDKQIS